MSFAGDFDRSTGDETLPLPAVEQGTRTPPVGDTSQSTPRSMPHLTGMDGRDTSHPQQPPITTYAGAKTPQYVYGGQPHAGGSAHMANSSESSRTDALMQMLIEAQKSNMAIIEHLMATRADVPPDNQQASSYERMRGEGPRLDPRDLTASYQKQNQVMARNQNAVVYTVDLKTKAAPDKPPSMVVLEKSGRFLDVYFLAKASLSIEESQNTDAVQGFFPKYSLSTYCEPTVTAAIAGNPKCMAELAGYIAVTDFAHRATVTSKLLSVPPPKFERALSYLCIRPSDHVVTELRTLLVENTKVERRLPLQPWPKGQPDQRQVSDWQVTCHEAIQLIRKICSLAVDPQDPLPLQLWGDRQMHSGQQLRGILLDFIIGKRGSSPQAANMYSEIERRSGANYADALLELREDSGKIAAATRLDLQITSFSDAWKSFTEEILTAMRLAEDAAARFGLPPDSTKTQASQRAAVAETGDELDPSMDQDEELRAIDTRNPGFGRRQAPQSNASASFQGLPKKNSASQQPMDRERSVCYRDCKFGVGACEVYCRETGRNCYLRHLKDFKSPEAYLSANAALILAQFKELTKSPTFSQMHADRELSPLLKSVSELTARAETHRFMPTQLMQKEPPRAAVIKIASGDLAPLGVEDAMADLLSGRANSSSLAAGAGEFESA